MKLGVTLFLLIACAFTTAPAATVTTFAGNGIKGYSGDGGPATAAQINNVFGVARGPDGMFYFCDMANHRVRRIDANGNVETYAGSAKSGYLGDGKPANEAAVGMPYELAWDRAGNLFIVDVATACVRRVDARTREITTIAGTGKQGFSGDGGPATEAQFNEPHSIAFDGNGDLYVCDIANHRVRKIDMRTGLISTWCGSGEKKTAPDGSPITGSAVNGPRALAFAPNGTCYLALREGNVVLLLDPKTNTLRRVAGTGKNGFTGNGGPALEATLSGPKCVSLDLEGNVYLADTESHSIRYIDVKKGTLEVLVGDGTKGDGPDGGDPLKCQLARPHGVFVDKDGAVFIGDSENHKVRVWRK